MNRGGQTWEIAQHFEGGSQDGILQALIQGTNAVSFALPQALSKKEIEVLFQKIDTSIIHLYLEGSAEGISSLLSPNINATIPYVLKEKVESNGANLDYLIHNLDVTSFEEDALAFLEKARYAEDNHYTITCTISKDYLDSIIKLRATRLLCKHVKKSMGSQKTTFKIQAQSATPSIHTSVEEDLIYSTIQLMAAVIGTADSILLKVSEKTGRSKEFAERITRNIHHLASYEARMDQVYDPLQGSYHVEKSTLEIAQKIWNKFIG